MQSYLLHLNLELMIEYYYLNFDDIGSLIFQIFILVFWLIIYFHLIIF